MAQLQWNLDQKIQTAPQAGLVFDHYIIRVSGAPPVIYSSQSRAKLVFLIEARPEPEVATRFQPGQPVDVSLVKPEHCLTETELVIDVRMLCGLLLPDAGRRRLETTFGIGKLHLA